jgi:hypothetical protein
VLSNNPNSPCPAPASVLLSVDPDTGHKNIVATFPFNVSHAVFDQAGDLVAVQKDLCSSSPAPTTTTSTKASGLTRFWSSGGSFSESPLQSVLEKWSRGRSSILARDVVAAAFVALHP